MSANNNIILNRFFSKNTFQDLIDNSYNDTYNIVISKYLEETSERSNIYLIKEVYKYIDRQYRNEYFYKNTLLNKLLLGKHSMNTTTALTEVPINKSKADFVLINGKAIVYEIKTELDSFERLESQLNDYYKAFTRVCVVTCETNYEKISQKLEGTKVGIYILTNRNTISIRKEPEEDLSRLEHECMFKILRKKEYEDIIIKQYGELPDVKPVKYYRECYELFLKIDIGVAYECMIRELKKRAKVEIEEYKRCVPYELKFLVYFSEFKNRDYVKLEKFLESRFGG